MDLIAAQPCRHIVACRHTDLVSKPDIVNARNSFALQSMLEALHIVHPAKVRPAKVHAQAIRAATIVHVHFG